MSVGAGSSAISYTSREVGGEEGYERLCDYVSVQGMRGVR